MAWYQWEVWSQGMKNGLIICQYYEGKTLKLVLITFPEVLFIHYMRNILLSCLSNQYLNDCLTFMLNCLQRAKFKHSSRENTKAIAL